MVQGTVAHDQLWTGWSAVEWLLNAALRRNLSTAQLTSKPCSRAEKKKRQPQKLTITPATCRAAVVTDCTSRHVHICGCGVAH